MSAMKIQHPFRVILAGALMLALGACATYSKTGQAAVVGTWTNSFGTVWIARADGTFSVDLNKDGKPDVTGRYTVDNDTITLQEGKSTMPNPCKGPAVYKFSRPDKNTLEFTLVKDSCRTRKQNVLLPWHLK
jgi:hypothetical protein